MPRHQVSVDAAGRELHERFAQIRAELKVPEEFPEAVAAEARAVADRPLTLPDRDESHLPFCTIDPPGSMDLDQALHIEREPRGYRVRYALAHLPSFVAPGGAIDTEARTRGETIYAPDTRVPLHPVVLSEGAASLLPDMVRPAYVWDMHIDSAGEGTRVEVYEALVRSTDRFDYAHVQQLLDGGTTDERLLLLREVGLLRIAREAARGGASLPLPNQEVELGEDGHYHVSFRPPVPCEDYNAQISLMTGMAAAQLMLRAGLGLLRTMPPASRRSLTRLRHAAHALGVPWQQDQSYGVFLRSLDRTNPHHLALIHEATMLFRGAGYTAFDGAPPQHREHAAVASTYAHVTAPLRRLGDRFCLALCASISAGQPVPDWVRGALPGLPAILSRADQLAGAVANACVGATEAALLRPMLGQRLGAVVVDDGTEDEPGRQAPRRTVEVQLVDEAVVARADGWAAAGERVDVLLERADVATSTVRFRIPDAGAPVAAAG